MQTMPLMYSDFARYWHLISAPDEYEEEALLFYQLLTGAGTLPRTLLELGSGGGNNAFYLKKYFEMTLTDLSPAMLAISKTINPELPHLQGDMRMLRLGRKFDAVFVHDAIMYMTNETELLEAFTTAAAHVKPGGIALFVPDEVRETFEPFTDCGGHDGKDGEGIRYLEWGYDPDPGDTTYVMDFAYLLRDEAGRVNVTHDRHVIGLFPRQTWLDLLARAGFTTQVTEDQFGRELFICRRQMEG